MFGVSDELLSLSQPSFISLFVIVVLSLDKSAINSVLQLPNLVDKYLLYLENLN